MAYQGTCKFFNNDRGFGFIEGGEGDEIFMHVTKLNGNPPVPGDILQYDVEDDPRDGRRKAVNVSGGTGDPSMLQRNQKGGGKGFGGGGGKGYGGGKDFGGSWGGGGYGGGW